MKIRVEWDRAPFPPSPSSLFSLCAASQDRARDRVYWRECRKREWRESVRIEESAASYAVVSESFDAQCDAIGKRRFIRSCASARPAVQPCKNNGGYATPSIPGWSLNSESSLSCPIRTEMGTWRDAELSGFPELPVSVQIDSSAHEKSKTGKAVYMMRKVGGKWWKWGLAEIGWGMMRNDHSQLCESFIPREIIGMGYFGKGRLIC